MTLGRPQDPGLETLGFGPEAFQASHEFGHPDHPLSEEMIKLQVDLIILLTENGYPPVNRDEISQEIFEQAENFKTDQSARSSTTNP